jgi:hypothetical protein
VATNTGGSALPVERLAKEDAMAVVRSGLVMLAILLSLGLLGLGPVLAQQGTGLASPEQKAEQDKAQQSKAGQAGTTEPSAHSPSAKPDQSAVFVDGRLAVPGAPADSQTVPSKFSERNAALDALPTMAFPLPLTDEQRNRIRDAVGKAPVESATARSAELLPSGIEVRELPRELTEAIPVTLNLGYVRTADRILLVSPANGVVVGEIAN